MRDHIQRQRNTSPLTTLKASSRPFSSVAAHTICSARMVESVMSVRPFHWVSLPGKTKGSPRSRQIEA
jgi:hypothetical protein